MTSAAGLWESDKSDEKMEEPVLESNDNRYSSEEPADEWLSDGNLLESVREQN